MKRGPVPIDIWRRPPGSRSIGWDFAPGAPCFYCEEPIRDFRSVEFRMPSGSIFLHEGECWDMFVVGVAAFNGVLLDQVADPHN